MKKYLLLLGLALWPWRPAMATWDVTTPAGTEAKSLGDDRIREFKLDIQNALQNGTTLYFPGSDTANPRFIVTIATFTTNTRPTGNQAPRGRIIINVSSGTFEIVDAVGAWTPIDVVPLRSILSTDIASGTITNTEIANSTITSVDILDGTIVSADIQDSSISGTDIGGGTVDSFNIQDNSLTTSDILDATITSADIAPGTITNVDVATAGITAINISTYTKFFARKTVEQSNTTGDGTLTFVNFDTEMFDTASAFSNSTFTAPSPGFYELHTNVLYNDGGAVGVTDCLLELVTTSQTYYTKSVTTAGSAEFSMPIDVILQMNTGNTATVNLTCYGGGKVVDVLEDSTRNAADFATFFWGTQIP